MINKSGRPGIFRQNIIPSNHTKQKLLPLLQQNNMYLRSQHTLSHAPPNTPPPSQNFLYKLLKLLLLQNNTYVLICFWIGTWPLFFTFMSGIAILLFISYQSCYYYKTTLIFCFFFFFNRNLASFFTFMFLEGIALLFVQVTKQLFTFCFRQP